jgi:hypothetical protein
MGVIMNNKVMRSIVEKTTHATSAMVFGQCRKPQQTGKQTLPPTYENLLLFLTLYTFTFRFKMWDKMWAAGTRD